MFEYSAIFIYPITWGKTFVTPPPALVTNTTSNWSRFRLANDRAFDLPQDKKVLTDAGFMSAAEIAAADRSFIRVFNDPYSFTFGNQSYTLNQVGSYYQVLEVLSVPVSEVRLDLQPQEGQTQTVDSSTVTCGCVLSQDCTKNNIGSSLDPVVELYVEGEDNPLETGVGTFNPLNDADTVAQMPYGTGTRWYIIEGQPLPEVGSDLDIALDGIQGFLYQKEAGIWVLKGSLKGPPGSANGGFSILIGDAASTQFTITHGFNNRNVSVQVWENFGDYSLVWPTIKQNQSDPLNKIDIEFVVNTPPAQDSYRVVVNLI